MIRSVFSTVLPKPNHQRKLTDACCTIISILLLAYLFFIALVHFNKQHLLKNNLPSDSNGRVCGLQYPNKPYLLFTDLSNISKRICIQQCPCEKGIVNCKLFSEQNYFFIFKSIRQIRNQEKICKIQDPQIKFLLQTNSQKSTKKLFFNLWNQIIVLITLSIFFGFVFVILVQCLPNIMNWIIIILGGITSIILGILIIKTSYKLEYKNSFALYVLSVIFIIVGVSVIKIAFLRKVQMKMNAVFLILATKMIRYFWVSLLYIPIFLFAEIGLMALTLFQLIAFWSYLPPVFDPNSIYWQLRLDKQLYFQIILVGVQLIWGLNIISQAFNFIITGNAVDYYYGSFDLFKSVQRLIVYHWGSVTTGSLMIGFFGFFAVIYNFFKQICWHICHTDFDFNPRLFRVIRYNVMSYINLTGESYFNNNQVFQFLLGSKQLFQSHESISSIFRFSGSLLLINIVTIIKILFTGFTTFPSLLFTIIVSYFIVQVFASLHSNAIDGICTSFLVQQCLQHGDTFLSIRNVIRTEGLLQQLREAVEN